MSTKHVSVAIDWKKEGKQVGDIRVQWSDNLVPLGYHSVPIVYFNQGKGPKILLIGGVHGDEFEGPSSLMRLVQDIEPKKVTGKIIIIPALNRPAISVSERNSHLDGKNLNRVFPGKENGTPTDLISYHIEKVVLPDCDVVIDLHSGGKAYYFSPCTLVTDVADQDVLQASLAMAREFALPTLWKLGEHNDDRSVNSAAARNSVPMIAAELGGGGGSSPQWTNASVEGLYRCLKHLGVYDAMSSKDVVAGKRIERTVQTMDLKHSLNAPGRGLFDRMCKAGTYIQKGDIAGYFHWLEEPERPSLTLQFPTSGFILAHINRGMVNRGELLYLITQETKFNFLKFTCPTRNNGVRA